MSLKKTLLRLAYKMGYIVRKKDFNVLYPDLTGETEFLDLYKLCSAYTMTSVERMYALYQAVSYVLDRNIPGDFVECGVWRGGSALMMARMLAKRGITDRKVYLYDTYEGMTPPSAKDVSFDGQSAVALMERERLSRTSRESIWCVADLDDVKNTLKHSGLDFGQIVFVQGKVEDTLPHTRPAGSIALLRLDTDWYESTLEELVYLYPSLEKGGPLIVDDYGYWQGCRKAVDEYFEKENIKILLNRIDNSGRMALKP